jgi:peptide subunit release factor 1 (eRF1)
MPKITTGLATPLREQLDRLASFEPTTSPVLSLYLDMRADQQGRRTHETFLRKVFTERRGLLTGGARKSFDRDASRFRDYLDAGVPPSIKGLAIFACAAADDFFEAIQLEVPFDQHALFVGPVPHLYQLARLNDQYPAYAALLADTNSARLFVFRLGHLDTQQRITSVKTRRGSFGGWSEARYQRHCDNFHLHHMKEVVAVLDRVVREDAITQIVIAADAAARPFLMEQLPKHLASKVVDVLHLDINTPEHRVLAETLEALREHDMKTDAEHVQAMLDGWASGGLGVAGPEATLDALAKGQVEELLIAARPDALRSDGDNDRVRLAGELVARAQQNGARVRFVEETHLLSGVGGVGAVLRFRITS